MASCSRLAMMSGVSVTVTKSVSVELPYHSAYIPHLLVRKFRVHRQQQDPPEHRLGLRDSGRLIGQAKGFELMDSPTTPREHDLHARVFQAGDQRVAILRFDFIILEDVKEFTVAGVRRQRHLPHTAKLLLIDPRKRPPAVNPLRKCA